MVALSFSVALVEQHLDLSGGFVPLGGHGDTQTGGQTRNSVNKGAPRGGPFTPQITISRLCHSRFAVFDSSSGA